MAHHIFRRCVIENIVPPVPPVVYGDYRLVLGANFAAIVEFAPSVEFGTSVAGLDVMTSVLIRPIPPGVDTGLGYYRLDVGAPGGPIILISGIEINGATAAGGISL